MAKVGYLIFASIVLGVGHSIYLLSVQSAGSWPLLGDTILWIFVFPLFVFCVLDYRSAILVSVVATPFFETPAIPHFFSQGLGDIFAVAVVCGFLLRYRWRIFQYSTKPEIFLYLIPASSLVSIIANLGSFGEFNWEGIKSGLADAAGLILAVSYALVLATSIRSPRDFRIFLTAVFVAAGVSIIHGLVSFAFTYACIGGWKGSVMSPGLQIAGGFLNPNYYASWLVFLLPFLLWAGGIERQRNSMKILFLSASIVVLLLIMLTLSRAALLASLVVLLFCVLMSSKLSRVTVLIIMLVTIVFSTTALQYRIWNCYDRSANKQVERFFVQSNILNIGLEKFKNLVITKELASAPEKKELNEVTKSKRENLLFIAVNAWASNPVFGIGSGNLKEYTGLREGKPNKAHNIFATILAEQGVVGLLVWLMLFGVVSYKILKVIRSEPDGDGYINSIGRLALLMFISITVTSMFSDQFRSIWLWQFFGLVFSLQFSRKDISIQR